MQSFASFMKPGAGSPLAASGKPATISPFDLMQGSKPAGDAGKHGHPA